MLTEKKPPGDILLRSNSILLQMIFLISQVNELNFNQFKKNRILLKKQKCEDLWKRPSKIRDFY